MTGGEDASKVCRRIHHYLDGLPMLRDPSRVPTANGLYFFYEKGEKSPHGGPRIVRVGNHPRSQGRLVVRLQQHYSGNKNSSVFRRFLGGAILRRRDSNHPCLQPQPGRGHWEKQGSKTCDLCRPVEREVSALLRDSFRFRVLRIVDRNSRNLFERGLISSLSACPQCTPSEEWLGRYAYSEKVASSG
ncbi:MAG: hypothetical protein ACE5IJ_04540, partial [Thermoplasmata archaeon]